MSKEMAPMEIDALVNTVRAFTPEQLKIVVNNIPVEVMCKEIAERHNSLLEKLTGINDIMRI